MSGDDSPRDPSIEGGDVKTGNTFHDWPLRHGGGYPPGWQVRYRCRVRRAARDSAEPSWQEKTGTIVGRGLRDEHTSTTWVPVRPRGTAADTPVSLVRATDILDARPPSGGANLAGETPWPPW